MLKVSTCFYNCINCAKHGDSASVSVPKELWMYKGDVNSALGENWKETSSSTTSKKASFSSDSNQILILRFLIPRPSLPSSPSLWGEIVP